MPKQPPHVQTRRCVSVRPEIYEQLKARSVATGEPMSSILERLIEHGLLTSTEPGKRT